MGVTRKLAAAAAVVTAFTWGPSAHANHSHGATYTGTHQAGGPVEFDVNADGTAITRIRRGDLPGNGCTFGESTTTGSIPITDHAFSFGGTSSAFQFSGSFHGAQVAQGTLRLRTFGPGACDSGTVTWTASTTTPPPGGGNPPPPPGGGGEPPPPGGGPDTTPPPLDVSIGRSQRIGRGRIPVGIDCGGEPCTVAITGSLSVPGAARTFRLSRISAQIPQGGNADVTIRLSRAVLRAARGALAKRRRVVASITVTAQDAAGNLTTARRSVRLRP